MEGEPESDIQDEYLDAGFWSAGLIAHPEAWINRRVETIELLSHEETRHRVSVDFTLPEDPEVCPGVDGGIAVPLAILAKQPRRHFDLQDEAGNSIPVLGREQNSELTHIAIMGIALGVIDDEVSSSQFSHLADQLWTIVTEPPELAFPAAGSLLHEMSRREDAAKRLATDEGFLRLLGYLAQGYVLFALLKDPRPRRRILKFSYGERFDFEQDEPDAWWTRAGVAQRWKTPDSQSFLIDVEMTAWAKSFHLEVAIPEELRASEATFYAEGADGLPIAVGEPEYDVDRISLYAGTTSDHPAVSGAYIELIPERSGQIAQGFAAGVIVSITLLAGAIIGIDRATSDAAVSILLVGTAFYSGLSAASGKHRVVRKVFARTREAMLWIAGAAVVGSLSLTLDICEGISTATWLVAGTVSFIATLWLLMAFWRAAR